jgi:hypothetical protein
MNASLKFRACFEIDSIDGEDPVPKGQRFLSWVEARHAVLYRLGFAILIPDHGPLQIRLNGRIPYARSRLRERRDDRPQSKRDYICRERFHLGEQW